MLLSLYRDGQLRKFSVVPDKNDRQAWDVRHFSQKIESLRDSISDEARAAYQDEVRKLLQAKEKARSEMQKERFQSLKKVQEESQRLSRELQRLQQEKDKLAADAWKKYADELKLIQEELRRIQERIRSEAEEGAPEKAGGR
jgi:chromosome segregation ATPase